MKKIINGVLYNTATAEELAEWNNGLPSYDLDSEIEILYRKKNGQLFLYGRSAYDDFNKPWLDGTICEVIRPTTIDEAKYWAEKRIDADDYEKIFGKVSEGNDLVSITFQLEQADWDKFQRAAISEDLSVDELVKKTVTKALKQWQLLS